MNKSIKISRLFTFFVAAVMCITCLCSCGNVFNPDRIVEIYFVSFTGVNNTLYMNAEKLGPKWTPLLEQKEAIELAHEVESIPDPVSAEGEYSYIIRINYVEDGVVKNVEKTGYNTFPDNWDKVIELTNKVGGEYDQVSNSRELAVVDADYVRDHSSGLDESIIPDDMTLDDIIKGAPITYLTLFDPVPIGSYLHIQDVIVDYLYDYFDLKSHQIEKIDDNPAKSSEDEMKKFAESRLDEVVWDYATEYGCAGKYKGEDFEIIRYDMVQTWLDKQSKYYDKCGFTGPHCQYQTDYQWELEGHAYTQTDVFVDGSGKYLILTNCRKPAVIADVVK